MAGLEWRIGRNGKPIQVLAWEDGTRSEQEGKSLRCVARELSLRDLRKWYEVFRKSGSLHDEHVLRDEITRRFPPQAPWAECFQPEEQ
jgi:hypothetical protein